MVGQRDADYRSEIGVESIVGRVRYAADEVRQDAERVAIESAPYLDSQLGAWWLHLELDVLDRHEFRACGAASDESMPEGLTWSMLTTVLQVALRRLAAMDGALACTTPTWTQTIEMRAASWRVSPTSWQRGRHAIQARGDPATSDARVGTIRIMRCQPRATAPDEFGKRIRGGA